MSDDHGSILVDLLQRARGGDNGARDQLFEKCRSYVGLMARAQVESWMRAKIDASDLVQQTMMEAHRGFDEFRGRTEREWLAWLCMILRHNAADFVRRYRGTEKRQARREFSLQMPRGGGSECFFFDPSDDGESPSQALLRREREIEVADAVAQLADDYQEVIVLRNVERLPFDEVARRMGRSRPAVQMLWLRALCKLEEILKKQAS